MLRSKMSLCVNFYYFLISRTFLHKKKNYFKINNFNRLEHKKDIKEETNHPLLLSKSETKIKTQWHFINLEINHHAINC